MSVDEGLILLILTLLAIGFVSVGFVIRAQAMAVASYAAAVICGAVLQGLAVLAHPGLQALWLAAGTVPFILVTVFIVRPRERKSTPSAPTDEAMGRVQQHQDASQDE